VLEDDIACFSRVIRNLTFLTRDILEFARMDSLQLPVSLVYSFSDLCVPAGSLPRYLLGGFRHDCKRIDSMKHLGERKGTRSRRGTSEAINHTSHNNKIMKPLGIVLCELKYGDLIWGPFPRPASPGFCRRVHHYDCVTLFPF
jgi:hypothetical protein